MTFEALNLKPALLQAISELGYTAPTPIQNSMVPLMVQGHDVIGQAQTGTGKTAAFALPILQNLEPSGAIKALVLAPTRELALQVAEAFEGLARYHRVSILPVYGGQPYAPQLSRLRRGVDIVVGTPGRLIDLLERGALNLSQVQTVVLDEADEMLSMGFIEDIETLLRATPSTRQTALFSATLPPEIRRLAERHLKNPQQVAIKREQVTVETIEQRYYLLRDSDKLAALTRLFEVEEISRAIVFVRTRVGTGDLANELTLRGFPAEALSGDMSQEARERTLNRFRQDQIKVLVATDVAARGLDIEGISHVFNYDLPDDPEVYVHRIGRTGRAGRTGVAISLLSHADKRRLRQIEMFTKRSLPLAQVPSETDVYAFREEQLLRRMQTWLQRGRFARERELVEHLQQQGHDLVDVAAAALKLARAEEKQRPLDPILPLEPQRTERKPRRPEFRSRRSDAVPHSHEAGMVRLSLNVGKAHGVRPNDIVGTIAYQANVPGRVIGKIVIQDKTTFVDVPEGYVAQVMGKTRDLRIGKKAIEVELA